MELNAISGGRRHRTNVQEKETFSTGQSQQGAEPRSVIPLNPTSFDGGCKTMQIFSESLNHKKWYFKVRGLVYTDKYGSCKPVNDGSQAT